MNSANKANLDKAVFIISLDTELAWGTRSFKKYKEHYQQKREMVDRLLDLFIKYDIKATWAIVGHLFLDKCEKINGVVHPEVIRPKYRWLRDDWFDIDPASDIHAAPAWYGKDIVEKIINCRTKQEIGCHTFSHIDVGEAGCTKECFASELKECQLLAERFELKLKSFVYPKNDVAMVDILKENNYYCFRDYDNNWYKNFPKFFRKIFHIVDNFLCLSTPSVMPTTINNVWSISGSYFYAHSDGWAKFLPISFRVKRAEMGIDSAVDKKQIFHLWFHPFNLASDPDGLFRGLEEIFVYFKLLREKGLITNLTMGETADYLNKRYDSYNS